MKQFNLSTPKVHYDICIYVWSAMIPSNFSFKIDPAHYAVVLWNRPLFDRPTRSGSWHIEDLM